MTLRAAVIGLGVMGARHARVWPTIPSIELVAVADPLIPIPGGLFTFSDFRTMLAEMRVDLVSVAVPTSLHREVTIAALQMGCHVLVEKPIAVDRGEAREMMAAARDAGRILTVGHIERFNPAITQLRQMLPELGPIYEIHASRSGPFPARIRDVGVVVDLAPHDLDLMRYLTRSEPIRLYAEMERRVIDQHEDVLAGVLRFANGVIGTLNINWLAPTKFPHMLVVTGEDGTLEADLGNHRLDFYPKTGRLLRIGIEDQREPLAIELEAFAEAVRSGGPPPVPPEDATIALLLSRCMIAAARYGSVISGQGLRRAISP